MTATETHVAQEFRYLPTGDLEPAPDNPRWELNLTEEFISSVKAVGVIQPLIARPHPDHQGRFEIVCGHRRHGAATEAGREEVPVIVRDDLDEPTRLALMFEENHHRGDLSQIEEAYALKRMVELPGMTQTKAAQKMGLAQPTASKRLKLLKLPQVAQDALHKRFHDKANSGGITVELAEELADLPADDVVELWNNGEPQTWKIHNAVTGARRKQELAKQLAELEVSGVRIIDEPDRWDRQDGPVPIFWLGFDDEAEGAHASEPCHAAAVDGGVDVTLVCTEPGRHRDPEDAKRTAAEQRARAKEDRDLEAERKAASDAATARTEFLRTLLAGGEVLGAAAHIAFNLLGAAVHEIEPDTVGGAWSLLGREFDDIDELYERLPLIAAEASAGLLEQLALAVALAEVEMQLSHPWCKWTDPQVVRHFEFLRAHGYELTDHEKEELAVAQAEAFKADVEKGVQDELIPAVEVIDVGTSNPAVADVPDALDEPAPAAVHEVKITKSGKKWRAKCTCGGLNTLNTTEVFAAQAGEAHRNKAVAEASS